MISFGILTAPQQVSYADLVRVWEEADTLPELEHAWVFDHLLPIGGDPDGPILEGWTVLSALAARTDRLRLGTMVTSNRLRPPAVLAKIATTVDHVSGGRLDLGIGVGSRPQVPIARREYAAHGLPYLGTGDAVERLAESLTVIKRLWTATERFDFEGEQVRLTDALANPKPVQRPHPPILIGGGAPSTLRLVAEHADLWNYQGGDPADGVRRGRELDRYCEEIGRDPTAVTRSMVLGVDYHDPGTTRASVDAALETGFTHLVLSLPTPYLADVAHWLVEEVVNPSAR